MLKLDSLYFKLKVKLYCFLKAISQYFNIISLLYLSDYNFVNAKIDCSSLYCSIPNNYKSLGIILLLYGHININCFHQPSKRRNKI